MHLSLIISVSTSSSGDSKDCSCPYDNLSAAVNHQGCLILLGSDSIYMASLAVTGVQMARRTAIQHNNNMHATLLLLILTYSCAISLTLSLSSACHIWSYVSYRQLMFACCSNKTSSDRFVTGATRAVEMFIFWFAPQSHTQFPPSVATALQPRSASFCHFDSL